MKKPDLHVHFDRWHLLILICLVGIGSAWAYNLKTNRDLDNHDRISCRQRTHIIESLIVGDVGKGILDTQHLDELLADLAEGC